MNNNNLSQAPYNPSRSSDFEERGFNAEANPYGIILNYDSGRDAEAQFPDIIQEARQKLSEPRKI
jgi:hypothetical protein